MQTQILGWIATIGTAAVVGVVVLIIAEIKQPDNSHSSFWALMAFGVGLMPGWLFGNWIVAILELWG